MSRVETWGFHTHPRPVGLRKLITGHTEERASETKIYYLRETQPKARKGETAYPVGLRKLIPKKKKRPVGRFFLKLFDFLALANLSARYNEIV